MNDLMVDPDFGIMLGFHTISSLFNYLIIDLDFGIMLGFHTNKISLLFNDLMVDPDFGIMLGFHTISSLFNYLIINPDWGCIMLGFHTVSLLFNDLMVDPDWGNINYQTCPWMGSNQWSVIRSPHTASGLQYPPSMRIRRWLYNNSGECTWRTGTDTWQLFSPTIEYIAIHSVLTENVSIT